MRPFRTLSPPASRWLTLLLLALMCTMVTVWAYASLRAAANDLAFVREELESAAQLVNVGDVGEALQGFRRAELASADAVSRVNSPAVRLVGFLPRLDATVDSIVASTEATHLIAQAGTRIVGTLVDLPGGLDALTLGGGGQEGWLEAASRMRQPLDDALSRLLLAQVLVATAPTATISPQVDAAREILESELGKVVPAIDDIAALVDVLPELFGEDGERRYFLGAQNPAELRGSGGLIGAYAVLTAYEGQISISSFAPIQDLPQNLFDEDIAPSQEFFERYQLVIDGLGTWLNVNYSPHFPDVAETIERMFREATGERLDGTIVVDPFALQSMLAVTGAVTVPDPEIGTLSSDRVVPYVVNEAPLALGVAGERKEILGEAARAVLREFLSGDVTGRQRISALAESVSGGHLIMHAASPEVQAALSRLSATGSLPDPSRTSLTVAINNTALSKADFWLHQRIHWRLNLDPDGTATATAVVEVENGAPADAGIPRYIIGPNVPDLVFGESWPFITVYCGTCEVRSVRYEDSDHFGAPVAQEHGHTLTDVRTRVPLGQSARIEYTFELSNAWRRSGPGGELDLQVWTPPAINSPDVTIEVIAPPGWLWNPADDDQPRVDGRSLILEEAPTRTVLGPFSLSTSP